MHSAADDVNEGVIHLIRAFRREPRKRRVGCFVLVVLGEHTRRPPIHKLTTTLGCFRTHAFLRVFDGSSGVICREGAQARQALPWSCHGRDWFMYWIPASVPWTRLPPSAGSAGSTTSEQTDGYPIRR